MWPRIMTNVINACRKHGTKLVFFDNVYPYGKVDGWMTEESPMRPVSRKGEVRARIADQLMREVRDGSIEALIARSADFYGPNVASSVVEPMIFERLKQGKKAQWLVNPRVKHTFTYTPDAGKATALLGNTDSAFGQVWHLPTDRNALTGEEFIGAVAGALETESRYSVFKPFMIKLGGLFDPIAKESVEMLYQFDSDYLFDSTKFVKEFFAPVSYQDGIGEIAQGLERNRP
jgi:nucleoside-diphosphate-sugar epimerase